MKTFRGGIHPDGHKNATCAKPIVDLTPPEELIYPLSQHIGAPAVPVVKPGESVLMGQKIAEAGGFVSCGIHASISGTVKAIEKRLHPSGTVMDCIIITNDGKDTPDPALLQPKRDYKSLSSKDMITIIQEAGIVGMGGAAFPTHVKFSPPPEAHIDYVIINGAECEPYLTSDHRAMLETPDEIITGLCIILQIFGLEEGYIGIENNKPDAIAVLKEKTAQCTEKTIHVVPVKTKYPQGAEKQLINAITGRKVKPGQLPWQVGCIVSNIDTCASVMRAVVDHQPLMRRIVTIGGDALKNPMNYRVRIGTPFSYILNQSGGFSEEPQKIIMGGPMMGIAVPNADVPVIKGTSGILAFGAESARLDSELPCVRCAKCLYACPMNLQPNLLDKMARADNFAALEKLHINDCIECGSCAYVCPSKRRQVQQIKVAKIKMKNAQNKAQ
ncbi:electron transport complex subunit RsxC [Ructibacterium gallinarum]|uniref:Ion-translocating oxidoreductase complex subunit C n=1 Tax=Ructibacterium gallinarum TaxID=2779355 RepID=A0A9D5LXZ0_9FIRM|nr:electron transport complex subunit RsxC [Ructibacterium gallinarum]MBE5040008.1 electron transport complex subunit RsxC [Ructibacterium gallinarum]